MKTLTTKATLNITSELKELLQYAFARGLDNARSEILGKLETELEPIMRNFFYEQEIKSFNVETVTCPDFTHPKTKKLALFSPEFIEMTEKLIRITKPHVIADLSVMIENALRRAILPYFNDSEIKGFSVVDLTNYRSHQL